MKFKLFYLFIVLFGIVSCNESGKETNTSTTNKKPKEVKKTVPVFNADSAYQYVADQVGFGPRVPNTSEHVTCRDYLESSLKSFGFNVIRQEFDAVAYNGTVLKSFNIIGTYKPYASKRILLASHWDSRPYADRDPDESKWREPIDGANDGASGVGILLEIARTINLAKDQPDVGVDIVLFDSEDYGAPAFYEGETKENGEDWCLGSQYWSKNRHVPNYRAYFGILLDMVGASDATFYKEGVSMHYAPNVVQKIWSKANSKGYGKYFVNDYCSPIIDDHKFVNEITAIPMIDIIHYNHANESQFFGNYWHTHNDTMDAVDKETLEAVGQILIEVLYSE